MSAAPITMVDLFAGIGGIRLGFELAASELREQGVDVDVQTLFASEWDRHAVKTYVANNPNDDHSPLGDITLQATKDALPEWFDVLLAGFPCQPFSLAGVSKKESLGRAHGFEDPTQGTLFHEIVTILRDWQPQAFLLENVKHLLGHDRGRTFAVITDALNGLPYRWTAVVRSAESLVPQKRERVYFVGYWDEAFKSPRKPGLDPRLDATLPRLEGPPRPLTSILHGMNDDPRKKAEDDRYMNEIGLGSFELSEALWSYLQNYKERHRRRGNGFGYDTPELTGPSRTMSARYHKDGAEILIRDPDLERPRRLTPREAARLQGFPEKFDLAAVSRTQLYRQFGNSVAVPVVREFGMAMLNQMVAESALEETKVA